MHESVMEYVRKQVERFDLSQASCLDVGSYDVNGSVKDFFFGEYVGVDQRPGPNVDLVLSAHNLLGHFGPEKFDVVVCCEMLEHDTAFWRSIRQMGGVLKPTGRLILTTRGIGFPLHEYPTDLWRFTPDAGHLLGDLAGLIEVEVEEDPQVSGIFVTGVKP